MVLSLESVRTQGQSLFHHRRRSKGCVVSFKSFVEFMGEVVVKLIRRYGVHTLVSPFRSPLFRPRLPFRPVFFQPG